MAAGAATHQESIRRDRRELRIALAISFMLVILRSWVFAAYEHSFFDSDQAVTGLMAKHLSEGRAFPLFMYGQPYQLSVEAWLAVPVFWIMGPTVAALRTSLVVTNLAIAAFLVIGLYRWGGLRPLLAVIAAVFFCFSPPFLSSQLLEAGGGNILPLLIPLLLWSFRYRPVWFGAILAIGFLTREFIVLAVPVFLLGQLWSRTLLRREVWRDWAIAGIVFVLVVGSVYAMQGLSNPRGPGTRSEGLVRSAGSQLANVGDRVSLEPREFPERARAFFFDRIPELLGAKETPSPIGRWEQRWLMPMLGVGVVAGLLRLGTRFVRYRRAGTGSKHVQNSFAWYLLGVGLAVAVGYVITRPADAFVHRYFLLVVYIPIGFTALWLVHEPNRWWRGAIVAAVIVWAGAAAFDNWRCFEPFAAGRQPNPTREIADALEARGVRVATANYWRAYKITFLTQERVRIASADLVRIDEYQKLADLMGDRILHLRDRPCPGGEPAGTMYLCR